MNKKLKFIVTISWILFSRSYDAYCTFRLTPDLTKEANPLVTIVGIDSWSTLLIVLGMLTIYTIYTYYLSIFKTFSLLPSEKNYSFSNIIAYIYLGTKASWTSIFYKFPKDINRFNHYMGHFMSRCLVYAGFISTAMWILINNTNFYKSIHSPMLVYGILIIGTIYICYLCNKSFYKKYLLETQGEKQD